MEVSAGNHRGKWWDLTGQAMFHDRKTSNGFIFLRNSSENTRKGLPFYQWLDLKL
jgi:hypothetical protein